MKKTADRAFRRNSSLQAARDTSIDKPPANSMQHGSEWQYYWQLMDWRIIWLLCTRGMWQKAKKQPALGLIRPAEQSTRCASAEALDSLSPVAIKSALGLYSLDTSYQHTGEA